MRCIVEKTCKGCKYYLLHSSEYPCAKCNRNGLLVDEIREQQNDRWKDGAPMDEIRLIDADKLKKALCEFMKNNIGIYSNEIFHIVDSMPTVEERPHGEWVDGKWQTAMECKNCGCPCQQYVKHFCANCGADMRKGGTE